VSVKKIALVYDVVYPYVKGGGERRFYEFGTRLASNGYEVHWYSMKCWDGPKNIDLDGMHLHGICRARPLYTESGRRSISEAVIFGLSCLKLLFVDFDVIDCCGFPYFSIFPAKLASIIKRKPLYSTWHEVWGKKYWIEYLGKFGYIGFQVEKLAARLPTRIITGSQHTADLLEKHLNVHGSAIIANGINLSTFSKLKPRKDSIDIIYVGRIMDFKNIDLIIESLADFKKHGRKLSCLIIGKGPNKKKLQTLAKQIGVETQITWMDFIEDVNDVYAYMKTAKVFVLPSQREGFGLVAVEANANGTPVLTANYPTNAAKDLIKDGVNGYVFEPVVKDLSHKLNKALKEYKQLECSSIDYVKNYDWDNLSSELEGVYSL
jgi:glycosyltransferase involved in cell wall biosynthesis